MTTTLLVPMQTPPMTECTSNESSSGSGSGTDGKSVNPIVDSSNSGYSADGSTTVGVPPVYIDFLEATTASKPIIPDPTRDIGARSNRRKSVELALTASRAKQDLEKAGMTVPQIQTGATRDLEGCKIDMSKVKLTMAKAVKDSPFLFAWKTPVVIPENSEIYDSLFTATYQSYQKNDTFHWDSSTSSVTSSDNSSSSMPPPALVIQPHLEDSLKAKAALKANEEAKVKRTKRKRALMDATTAKLLHITMNDALESSAEARVVTLSFSPFIVVHVNTSYTRLTGFSSAKVLGKPLHECIGGKCKDWLDNSCTAHPIATLHERVSNIQSSKGNRRNRCILHAQLVGPQLEGKSEVDTSSVTHYSICFQLDHQGDSERGSRKKPKLSFAPEAGHKCVMG